MPCGSYLVSVAWHWNIFSGSFVTTWKVHVFVAPSPKDRISLTSLKMWLAWVWLPDQHTRHQKSCDKTRSVACHRVEVAPPWRMKDTSWGRIQAELTPVWAGSARTPRSRSAVGAWSPGAMVFGGKTIVRGQTPGWAPAVLKNATSDMLVRDCALYPHLSSGSGSGSVPWLPERFITYDALYHHNIRCLASTNESYVAAYSQWYRSNISKVCVFCSR